MSIKENAIAVSMTTDRTISLPVEHCSEVQTPNDHLVSVELEWYTISC